MDQKEQNRLKQKVILKTSNSSDGHKERLLKELRRKVAAVKDSRKRSLILGSLGEALGANGMYNLFFL